MKSAGRGDPISSYQISDPTRNLSSFMTVAVKDADISGKSNRFTLENTSRYLLSCVNNDEDRVNFLGQWQVNIYPTYKVDGIA